MSDADLINGLRELAAQWNISDKQTDLLNEAAERIADLNRACEHFVRGCHQRQRFLDEIQETLTRIASEYEDKEGTA